MHKLFLTGALALFAVACTKTSDTVTQAPGNTPAANTPAVAGDAQVRLEIGRTI